MKNQNSYLLCFLNDPFHITLLWNLDATDCVILLIYRSSGTYEASVNQL